MKNTLKISLRANEKIYLNGAVVRADRKVSIELLNDVQFLLESHVLQADQASTPLRQLYFILQVILINPAGADGLFYGNPGLFGVQLLVAAVTTIFSMVGTFVILKLVDSMTGLRVSSEEEATGLDLSQHNERAYS